MNVMNQMVSWISSCFATREPVYGTQFERVIQRTVKYCGWHVESYADNKVYFHVPYGGMSVSACIALRPNCLATVAVVGDLFVHDLLVQDVQQFLDKLHQRIGTVYRCSLVLSGQTYGHTITWTTTLEMMRANVLTDILPEMIRNSQCVDGFIKDLHDLKCRIAAQFPGVKN